MMPLIEISLAERLDFSPKQKTCFELLKDYIHTEILYGGGAGGGKSFLGCAWLIRNCLKYPGTRWLMGRSELKTLKGTTLKTFFEVAVLFLLVPDLDYVYNQQSGEIVFANKSEIILADLKFYPKDENFDRLGSLEITGGFIDECNQIVQKAKDVVKSRIRFKLDENGLIPKLLMSCNPAKNWTYQQFYKPNKERNPDGTKKIEPYRAFVQALVGDNPKISRHYVTNLDGLPKVLRMRLRDGIWEMDDDATTLMPYDKIIDMWSNTHVLKGSPYITCDAARYGHDKAKIAVWEGWRLIRWFSYPQSSQVLLADEIEKLMTVHQVPASNVVIDEDGVGGGVIDILRDIKGKRVKGFVNNSTPLDELLPTGRERPNYANLKAQCAYLLAARVCDGGIYIDEDVMDTEEVDALVTEMEQIKIKDLDKNKRLDIVPKDTVKELIGRSPDSSDTLLFRQFFELKPKPTKVNVY